MVMLFTIIVVSVITTLIMTVYKIVVENGVEVQFLQPIILTKMEMV